MKARIDRGQRQIMDRNLIEANIKLVDDNRYLKEDNKILLAKYEKIKKYINSFEFEIGLKEELREELERIIEGIDYE